MDAGKPTQALRHADHEPYRGAASLGFYMLPVKNNLRGQVVERMPGILEDLRCFPALLTIYLMMH